jgi:hypothetical protein
LVPKLPEVGFGAFLYPYSSWCDLLLLKSCPTVFLLLNIIVF